MSLLVSKQKFLVLLNPRCASRTLFNIFSAHCTKEELLHYERAKAISKKLDHINLLEAETVYSANSDLSQYTAVVSIRNPFERVISFYWFLKTLDFNNYREFVSSVQKYDISFYNILPIIKKISFNEFVMLPYFNDPYSLYSFHSFSLKNFSSGIQIQDKLIIRTEHLREDLQKIGIKDSIPHKHRLYRPEEVHISSTSKNIISSIFASDMLEGKY